MAKSSRRKVAIAMSGGVDSSVAALLLVQQGFDVVGLMLRLWSEPGYGSKRDNRCCTRDQMMDAHFVAKKLGIPFEIIDIREQFKSIIVDRFINDYRSGLTPNPCLNCNQHVRFSILLNEALTRGATYLATGHYARIGQVDGSGIVLRRGVDATKDQSYVLSRLDQSKLQHAMFPLGELTKDEVRRVAAQNGLRVAAKADSQDLCFLADGNYRRFLMDHSPSAPLPGPIVDTRGTHLGQHAGLQNYTIGQRKGLQIAGAEPYYVISKRQSDNTIVVGTQSELGKSEFDVEDIVWNSGFGPDQDFECETKIRYKSPYLGCRVTGLDERRVRVQLHAPARDVTPGQGAVFYIGDHVVGSGIIMPD